MKKNHSSDPEGKAPKRRRRDPMLEILRKMIPKHLRKKYRIYKKPDGGIGFVARGLTEDEALHMAYTFAASREMFKLINGEPCDPKYRDILIRLREKLAAKQRRMVLEEKARRAGPEIGKALRETLDGPHN